MGKTEEEILEMQRNYARKTEDLNKKIKQDREEFFKDEIESIDLLIAANKSLNSVYEAQESLLSSKNY